MKNEVFGCWYEPGDAGTWFTWFINQHHSFPNFSKNIRYEQKQNIPSDYSCYGANWVIKDTGDDEAFGFTDFEKNLIEKQISYNKDFYSICYKLIPWHNPFQANNNELENETNEQLASRLITESNTKAIIIPQVEVSYQVFAKRLAYIRPRISVEDAINDYKNRINKQYMNTVSQIEKITTVHTIAIDKLVLHNNEQEYNKLINILQVPALENWKQLTYQYYIEVYSKWEQN